MQSNTISVSPIPFGTTSEKIKEIFHAFSVKNVHIDGQTAFIEFNDEGDLEIIDIHFDNYEVSELNNAKIDKAEFDWSSVKRANISPDKGSDSSSSHQDLMAADIDNLIVVQNCDEFLLKNLSEENIRQIFKDFHSVNRILKRNNDLIVQFADAGQMEKLQAKFENFCIPQLGFNSKIQKAEPTKITPDDFVSQWSKFHTKESMLTQPSTNLGYGKEQKPAGQAEQEDKFQLTSLQSKQSKPSQEFLHQDIIPPFDKKTSMEVNFLSEQSKLGYQEREEEPIHEATTHQQLDYTTEIKINDNEDQLGYEAAQKKQEEEKRRHEQEERMKKEEEEANRRRQEEEQQAERKTKEEEQAKRRKRQQEQEQEAERKRKQQRQEEERQRKQREEEQRLRKQRQETETRRQHEEQERQRKQREEDQRAKKEAEQLQARRRRQSELLDKQLKEKLYAQRQKFEKQEEEKRNLEKNQKQSKHDHIPTEGESVATEVEAIKQVGKNIEEQLGYAVNKAKQESANLLNAGLELLRGEKHEEKSDNSYLGYDKPTKVEEKPASKELKKQEQKPKKTEELGYNFQNPKELGMDLLNSSMSFLKNTYSKFQEEFISPQSSTTTTTKPSIHEQSQKPSSDLGYQKWSVKPDVSIPRPPSKQEQQSGRVLKIMITITLFIWVIFLLMQDTSSGVEVSNVHEANLGVQSVEAADVEESGQSAQANENM